MSIVLSPSSLSDFAKCPRCWWLEKKHKLKLPRGAFPSLPGGMDRALKAHMDEHRAKGTLPPELIGKVPGKLFENQAQLKRWRFWKTGLQAEVAPGIIISGAFDDLLFDPATKLYSMIDYKTRGAAPLPGGTEQYYGIQANCYDAMLTANKMPTNLKGYFAYYWPLSAGPWLMTEERDMHFRFATDIIVVDTDPNKAAALAIRAAQCLEAELPKASANCEVCPFITEREQVIAEHTKEKEGAAK